MNFRQVQFAQQIYFIIRAFDQLKAECLFGRLVKTRKPYRDKMSKIAHFPLMLINLSTALEGIVESIGKKCDIPFVVHEFPSERLISTGLLKANVADATVHIQNAVW